MRIISFNTGHDGHICYVSDDKLVYSYEAEKDNNPRYSDNTPINIASGFSAAGGVDVVAVSGWAQGHDPRNSPTDGGYLGLEFKITVKNGIPWLYCSHELSHIICSYALSPYADREDCYVLLMEGFIGRLYLIHKDLTLELLTEVTQSPGLRYSFAFGLADPSFNLPKGYCRLGDAGKMMALAAFGKDIPSDEEQSSIIDYLLTTPSPIDTFSKVELEHSQHFNIGVQSQEFCNLARKVSNSLFDYIFGKVRPHIQETKPLLIAGGCGLNCDWNKKWQDSELFTDVFIPPCTNDTGVAIGAAALANKIFNTRCRLEWTVYSGQPFYEPSPSHTQKNYIASNLSLPLVSKLLLEGEVICWVQGNCEIGPRALGNRSIIAAPFLKSTTARLNKIKNREHYRPIAPICLEEDAPLHFLDCNKSKYMLMFHTVIDERLQAVTHVDGTARVQTVSNEDNPRLHELLEAFKTVSGVGVLCNTSLNFSGAGFINNHIDLEQFCTEKEINLYVVGNTMYLRAGAFQSAKSQL